MSDDAERETPSEAEARSEMRRVLDDGWTTTEEEHAAIAAYRAAVLRESAAARRKDDAATRRLIERLRHVASRWEWTPAIREADAWLAAHKEDEHG